MAKLVVLDGFTSNPGDLTWERLSSQGEFALYDWTEQEDVVERAKGAEAIFTNKVRIGDEIMSQLPELKYIGIMATGMDCVDLKAAKARNIAVTNIPAYADKSVAQLAMALILELCYRIDLHNQSIKDMYWSRQPYNSYWLKPLTELYGKTLGVIGMGRIGQRLAELGQAFGMNVIAYDVFQREIPNVKWVTVDELLRTSDVVSIHCPLMDSTRHMIDKEALCKMKKTAFFINTSRGPLMVDADVAWALNNDIIAGAGLDVLDKEPPAEDNPLLTAKNTVLTPHIGWATQEARQRLLDTVGDNYKSFAEGGTLNRVENR